jgi:hypothetical protein
MMHRGDRVNAPLNRVLAAFDRSCKLALKATGAS